MHRSARSAHDLRVAARPCAVRARDGA